MPPAKSMKRLPSTSSRRAPSPRAMNTGVMLYGPRGTAACRARPSSCERGPGTAVFRTMFFFMRACPSSDAPERGALYPPRGGSGAERLERLAERFDQAIEELLRDVEGGLDPDDARPVEGVGHEHAAGVELLRQGRA